jgi:MYXO-CTERM domain-containing protein
MTEVDLLPLSPSPLRSEGGPEHSGLTLLLVLGFPAVACRRRRHRLIVARVLVLALNTLFDPAVQIRDVT